ncbi:pyridoxal phosphate-dependent aminotransferase [Rhodococcus sp. NPDC057135]|uniref:pyridoxal phosphate-dependent aminotransferase n=1 Tax=Rhodococcus sp. NPDC057135 TaxID=3346028 RepID=UPI00363EEA06
MSQARPVAMSPTLAADELLARRTREGKFVLSMASGEIGLPVHPELSLQLAYAAAMGSYGPVAGSELLRSAAAGYWARRGLEIDAELVVAGPGSKSLLYALMLAIGGDVIIAVPSWVSYAAQTALAGARALPVPIVAGNGGVPDPDQLRDAVAQARKEGRNPRIIVVTVPDNPTGTIASDGILRRLAVIARELDLIIISDEIYGDLVYDNAAVTSPARHAPERTIITTGLTKNLALGGWRTGVARLPDSKVGRSIHTRLLAVASQIWSTPPAPIQAAAAYAFAEPPGVIKRIEASNRLHKTVVRAVAEQLIAAGAKVRPITATCYLYPDFEPLRHELSTTHAINDSDALAQTILEKYGIGSIPASAFGESPHALRIRLATSRLYGDTAEQQTTALTATSPLDLPWIRDSIARIGDAVHELTGALH